MSRFPLALTAGLLLLAFSLSACSRNSTPKPPTATPTPGPTATPTPLPPILRQPFAPYEAPGGAFTLQAPADWIAVTAPGGVRFLETTPSSRNFTAFYQVVPDQVDAATYLSSVVSTTVTAPEVINPDSYHILANTTTPEGRQRVEWVGQTEANGPSLHFLGEFWLDGATVAGLSLSSAEADWEEVKPLWTYVGSTLQVKAGVQAPVGQLYVHPSGTLTLTLPVAWNVLEDEEGEVLLQDASGLAQFSVAALDLERSPTPKDLGDALANAVGDAAKEDGYEQLASEQLSLHEQVLRFDALSPEEGMYRTELRAFSGGNTLYITSFSTPPGDTDLYAPAYEFLLNSMQLASPPLDDAVQDADSLLGIEVGDANMVKTASGVLVSAPIHNGRTRNLGDMTAAVEIYDASNELLGAESWRLDQRVVPSGSTTYLTKRIGSDVAAVDEASYAVVRLVLAKDTQDKALPAWEYVTGTTETNDKGDVIIRATLRNPSDDVRRYIFLVGLLYDEDGKLIFARSDTQRLPYAVPSGAEVDVRLNVPGPFSNLGNFNVVGEVPE